MRKIVFMVILVALPVRAEISRGPVLHASAPGTMTVTWDTTEEVLGEIVYGLDEMDQTRSLSAVPNCGRLHKRLTRPPLHTPHAPLLPQGLRPRRDEPDWKRPPTVNP